MLAASNIKVIGKMTNKTEGESAFSLMGQEERVLLKMGEKMVSVFTRTLMVQRKDRSGKRASWKALNLLIDIVLYSHFII
jgi:hypothetical protein